MGYLLFFIIFLLVMQFAFYLLPYLLPIFLVLWVISLFKKPNVHVYTNTYSYNNMNQTTSSSKREPFASIPLREPKKGSIDAEYTEYEED